MFTRLLAIMFFTSVTIVAESQLSKIDSLKQLLPVKPSNERISVLVGIADYYNNIEKYDTALNYYLNALKLAEEVKNKNEEYEVLMSVANFYEHQLKRSLALQYAHRAESIARNEKNNDKLFKVLDLIGGYIYFNQGEFEKSLAYGKQMQEIALQMNDSTKVAYTNMYMGDVYRVLHKYDSAMVMYKYAIKSWRILGNINMLRSSLNNIGVIYEAKKSYDTAIIFYKQALNIAEQQGYDFGIADYSEVIAKTLLQLYKYNEALSYAERAKVFFEKSGRRKDVAEIMKLLADIYYAKKDYKLSHDYLVQYNKIRDSLLFGKPQKNIDSLQTGYEYEKNERELLFLKKESSLQMKLRNTFIAISVLFVLVALLLLNRYKVKKRSEETLNLKNEHLNETLTELKAAQAQLIQSEKMASLGELTAGIAHEIQNPLNFVNNFSDVNKELISEMIEAVDKKNYDEVKLIANDIAANEEKINHHGKRAEAIVKSMLQHSGKSDGKKEPANINALVDEYLRLSYHGFRSKEKNFNVEIKTFFDESIGAINIVPQDIGRGLLNLFNNAFYAVNQKNKSADSSYKAVLNVLTKKAGNKIEIHIQDNGNGISSLIVDKIFQPFFTTKPTGQGTGLGLSLSYDIIKAHAGEIKVESKEGKGTDFIIILPI